ncbi:DUF2567 domain-containing protein [Parasphingorhabdus pacifica]
MVPGAAVGEVEEVASVRDEAPSESVDARAEPVRIRPDGVEGGLLSGRADTIPRVVVKADLLPALSALSLLALLGFPLAWAWSRLALPQESVLARNGELVPLLLAESYHEFDSLGVFMLLELALGVLSAAALWQLRGRRGPVMLIAGAAGSLVAAWMGARMGPSFAASRYPMPPELEVGGLVTVAPEITQLWVVLAAPLALAFTYGLLVAWNGLDDLGRRLR